MYKDSKVPKKVHATQGGAACPRYKEKHTCTLCKGNQERVYESVQFKNCGKFLELSPDERGELIKNHGGCPWCLDWSGGHEAANCQYRTKSTCTCG